MAYGATKSSLTSRLTFLGLGSTLWLCIQVNWLYRLVSLSERPALPEEFLDVFLRYVAELGAGYIAVDLTGRVLCAFKWFGGVAAFGVLTSFSLFVL